MAETAESITLQLIDALEEDNRDMAAALLPQVDVNQDIIYQNDNYENVSCGLLHYAAASGHAEMVELLVQHGAEVNKTQSNGATALHLTAQQGHMAAATTLLDHNATVSHRAIDGSTPLHLAVAQNNHAMASLLIGRGADVNAQLDNGAAPIHVAVLNGDPQMASLLLDNHADITLTMQFRGEDVTPLDLARNCRKHQIMELLQSHQPQPAAALGFS